MKIPEIKRLVEKYNIEQLIAAEEALVNEVPLAIEVNGSDEGEQLTHVFAAIYVINKMQDDKVDFKAALRDYSSKVRESIS
ncbi:hypothetical protein C900_01226 [Fulvivirga imtechensis AK7]|uniref:Uncharacterized protein n=1 Tax=Fulvivirga imtechensis AK7 TaxID=1237149 RepID=L8JZC8_9BACT|nr:hypothetical protein [Fulvivirga imtechensis]ELR72552.1 hypothetical protein C900_01226 [Fulvivirga imtechensis AK7]